MVSDKPFVVRQKKLGKVVFIEGAPGMGKKMLLVMVSTEPSFSKALYTKSV